jgi:hypothetical protein
MDEIAIDVGDPHAEIVRLEARIEELAEKLESCRKFVVAARIAMALGGVLLAAGLLGAFRLDALALTGAITAVLGGVVVSGSNGSTARQAAEQLAAAERDRAALIGLIELRVVGGAVPRTEAGGRE